MMLVGPLAGMLSDRFPAGILGGIGMAIATHRTCCCWLFCRRNCRTSTWCGAWRSRARASACFWRRTRALIVHSAPHERAASAGGLISTTRLTGQTLGATLLAALLSLGVGSGPVPALLAAALAVLAGICSLAGLRAMLSEQRARRQLIRGS